LGADSRPHRCTFGAGTFDAGLSRVARARRFSVPERLRALRLRRWRPVAVTLSRVALW